MTPTRAAPEAVLPPAQTEMQRLAELVEAADTALGQANDRAANARYAMQGMRVDGPDFPRRMADLHEANQGVYRAQDERISARNALSAALNQPRED